MQILLKIKSVNHNIERSLPIREAFFQNFKKCYLTLFSYQHIADALKINDPTIYNKIKLEITKKNVLAF